MAKNLPPLPPSPVEVGDLTLQTREHVQSLGWGNREQLYTAKQVRAYAGEVVKAERDRLLDDMRRAAQAVAWGAERLPEMELAYQKASAVITAFETKRIDNEDK